MDTTNSTTARPILAYSRISGEPLALVASSTDPSVRHVVTATTCSCKGFTYRSRCSHLTPVAQIIRQPLVARLMA